MHRSIEACFTSRLLEIQGWKLRAALLPRPPSSANAAPCGSAAWTTQSPPGTSTGTCAHLPEKRPLGSAWRSELEVGTAPQIGRSAAATTTEVRTANTQCLTPRFHT